MTAAGRRGIFCVCRAAACLPQQSPAPPRTTGCPPAALRSANGPRQSHSCNCDQPQPLVACLSALCKRLPPKGLSSARPRGSPSRSRAVKNAGLQTALRSAKGQCCTRCVVGRACNTSLQTAEVKRHVHRHAPPHTRLPMATWQRAADAPRCRGRGPALSALCPPERGGSEHAPGAPPPAKHTGEARESAPARCGLRVHPGLTRNVAA